MREVLKSIGKEQLCPKFINQDVANFIVFLQLTNKDLDEIGLQDDGKQIILDSINAIRDGAKEEKP